MAKNSKTSSQDRSIAFGFAPKSVAKTAKNEQPRSQHSEGIGAKKGGPIAQNKQPGSQHGEGMGSQIVEKSVKKGPQDRSIARGLAPKWVEKLQKQAARIAA